MADEQQWDSFRSTKVLSHNNAAIMDNDLFNSNLLDGRNLKEYGQSLQSIYRDDEEDPKQKCVANINSSSPFSRDKSQQDISSDFFSGHKEDSPKECHLWGLEKLLSSLVNHGCYLKCTTISGYESYTRSTSSLEGEKKEEHYLSCSLSKLDESIDGRVWGCSSEIVADEICKERIEETSPLDHGNVTEQHQCSNDWIEKQGIAIRSLEAMSYSMNQVVEELIGRKYFSSIKSTSLNQSSKKLKVSRQQEYYEKTREDNEQCDMDHSVKDDDEIDKRVSKLIEEQKEAIRSLELITSAMSQALDEFNISYFDSVGYTPTSSRCHEWITYWSDEYEREYFYNIGSKQICWFLPKTVIKDDGDKAGDSAYCHCFREVFPKEQLTYISYYFSNCVYIFLALIITLFFKSLAFLFATEFTGDEYPDQELSDNSA